MNYFITFLQILTPNKNSHSICKSIYYLIFLSILISCNTSQKETSKIVATNAWTAAYAHAAGIENVRVLTPYEMTHPTEYELRPGDIAALNDAEVIIIAGYEVMMDQIRTGLKIPEEKMIRIQTSYNMTEIEQAVLKIAERMGTTEIARDSLEIIRETIEISYQTLKDHGFLEENVAVHFFQQSFAREAGFDITSVFGPAPPEPRELLEITQTNATLIIDNAHNPSGGALKQTLPDARYVSLLNFPGLFETRTLKDVIEYNTARFFDHQE